MKLATTIILLVLPLFGAAQQTCELKSSMAHFEAAKLLFESGWKLRQYVYNNPSREYIVLQDDGGDTLSVPKDIFAILTADKRCQIVGETETQDCREKRFKFFR